MNEIFDALEKPKFGKNLKKRYGHEKSANNFEVDIKIGDGWICDNRLC